MTELEVSAVGQKVEFSSNGRPSEIPEPPTKLSAKEKSVWIYVTQALLNYGLIHKTDGMLLTVIVKTFVSWVKAEEKIIEIEKETGSIYVKTPNGFEQPHQAVYEARKLKRELLQWLPEAALTIPSFNKVVTSLGAPEQGSLFVDPVEQFRERKRRLNLRGINGGKS